MKNKPQQDEFYVGWQEKAPPTYARSVRRSVWWFGGLAIAVALLLVLSQRGFVDSTFELGKSTALKGVLTYRPVPMLKMYGADGVESVLLIGFGKRGAERTLAAIEARAGQPLGGKVVELKGTLIYYQDKTALELTKGADAFLGMDTTAGAPRVQSRNLGRVSLKGEILDPKCALGVMKPGYGKPHRSCAVRCISGGVPPVLRMTDARGNNNYAIVRGAEGEAINAALLPFIADQLRICGRLEQQDDWLVLYTDPQKDIIRLQAYWMDQEMPLCSQ